MVGNGDGNGRINEVALRRAWFILRRVTDRSRVYRLGMESVKSIIRSLDSGPCNSFYCLCYFKTAYNDDDDKLSRLASAR